MIYTLKRDDMPLLSQWIKNPRSEERGFFGATDPIRTDDLLITSELLYLLSHSSKMKFTDYKIILSIYAFVKGF